MTRAMTRAMTRRPTASTALPALAAALALALSGCGGGGGGTTPGAGTGGGTDPDAGRTPPAAPTQPTDPNDPDTDPDGGAPVSPGGGTTSRGGTPPPRGTTTATSTGGPLRGILWPNPDFDAGLDTRLDLWIAWYGASERTDGDGTNDDPPSDLTPVSGCTDVDTCQAEKAKNERVPYAFKASYTIPPDDPDTDGVNEREVYIQEIERDAEYAYLTALDIGRQLNDLWADWTPDMVRTIVVRARGASMGIDGDARADRTEIAGLIAELARLKEQAEAAKEAIATARMGEETRLREEVAKLREDVSKLEREIDRHEADAAQKDTDADAREAEIQDADHDGPNIPDLDTAASALNIDINRLNNEITDHEDDKAQADAWIVYYDTPVPDPDDDDRVVPPSYAPCQGDRGEANCRAKVTELANDLATKKTERDMKQAEETRLRKQITALQQDVTDLRAAAQTLRDMVPEKRTKADDLGQRASDLEGSIDEALAALQAAIDAIEAHIMAIEGEETRVKDRRAQVPVTSNVPALRVQERLLALAGSDSAPAATRLVRRAGTGFEDLDRPSDETRSDTFARATPTAGITPVDALRAIVRAAQPTVDVAQFVEERTLRAPAPTATSGTPEHTQQDEFKTLDDNLGTHWRMQLTGYLLADTDLGLATDTKRANTGNARGDSVPGTFRGVHGTFYCNGSSCGALTAATFGSGWFFTPSLNVDGGRLDATAPGSQTARFRYTANDDGTFAPLHYVDYGMWLVDGNPIDVQARAALVGPDPASRATPNLTSRADGRNSLGFDSATYSGTAHGLSARSRYEGSEYVMASGHFTADVELNATFGGIPTLGGTIDNFRSADTANQGDGHVNPAWSLTLRGWSPASDDAAGGLGTFDDGDAGTRETAEGHWSAWGHGAANARPDGFYGGFTAAFRDDDIDQAPNGANGDGSQAPDGNLFDDGAAIGVFSTERE